jgi:hypothetical protein
MDALIKYWVPAAFGSWLAVGKSGTAPTVTDTVMNDECTDYQNGSRLGTVDTVAGWGPANEYYYQRSAYRAEEGECVGALKEIGLSTTSSGGVGIIHTHALIVDQVGTPTTINKATDNVLDIFYEKRVYPYVSDASGTIDLSGVSYDYTVRAWRVGYTGAGNPWSASYAAINIVAGTGSNSAYTGTLGAITDTYPQGTSVTPSVYYDSTHSANTYEYAWNTNPWWAKAQVQVGIDSWHGTFQTITASTNLFGWQCQFNKTVGGTGITKTDEQRLRLHWQWTITRV